MRLTVSPEAARALILSIPHRTCAKALDEHWSVEPDGTVAATSILWLFCWAKTGMNSEDARVVAVRVFDEILPVKLRDCEAVIDHTYARKFRYSQLNTDADFGDILLSSLEKTMELPQMNRERVIATSMRIAELRQQISHLSSLQREVTELETSLDDLLGQPVGAAASNGISDAMKSNRGPFPSLPQLASSDSIGATGEEPSVQADRHPELIWLLGALEPLSPREEKVIKSRLGFTDGREHTFEEIADHFAVTTERVRQIYSTGRRRLLRHIRETLERELPRLVEPRSSRPDEAFRSDR